MSKTQKKILKNITKNKEKEKKEYPVKNKIFNFVKILYFILIMAILVCGITIISQGNYKIKDTIDTIDYTTITAGQTFSRNEEEYYVVFYLEDDIVEKITSVSGSKIYKVNLNSGINKSVLTDASNKDASNASELKFKETTIIKIMDGKNTDFVEGHDAVVNYLQSL